ncbi:hypothetical protein V8G54_027548 [Vigna mungo]|uniref:Uncharacterized protein n=1 Tax=Vigna mungo TaxID=3915 RepID=A0AAQ3RN60_VIGMU
MLLCNIAARAGNISTLKILLVALLHDLNPNSEEAKKAAILVANCQGNTFFHEALLNDHKNVMNILDFSPGFKQLAEETAFTSKNLRGKSVLHLAIEKGYQVDDLLTRVILGYHQGIKDDKGRNALHYAASIGYLDGVQFLLESCDTCHMESDNDGSFPLHLASACGHTEVVKKLLEICPNPKEIVDEKGRNIVHIAAIMGQSNVIRYILQDAKDEVKGMINGKDYDGNTPLHLAASHCHPKVVQALTWDTRVDLHWLNNNNQTALDAFQQFKQEDNPPFPQRLTWCLLKSAGIQNAKRGLYSVKIPSPCKPKPKSTEFYKDRINTLMVVSTLITTVAFAAGFTLPGGTNSSIPEQGMAIMLHHVWFKPFIFCITASMYGGISVTIILIWAQLGDITLALFALNVATPLLGVTLATLAVAFLAGVHLVISDLNWLATTIMILCVIFILLLLLLYILLSLPSPSSNLIMRWISYFPFKILTCLFEKNSTEGTQQLAPTVGQGFKNSQRAMATKFDVEKFNGANDFGLWKIKMEAILIQQGCDEALKGESRMSGTMTQEEKKKMGDKARSAIILCLGDKVLREVAKEKTAAEIWAKLESLYMTRSLAHRLCLKQQLFSFKMSESRTIEEQIAEFSKIVDDLENIEVKLEDEDKAVILLNALPKTFEHFRDALLYGKDQVITLEEVLTSIRTKEFQKLQDSKTTEEGASGLIAVKGKGKKQSGKEKKLNPDGTKQVRCFKCQKMGHIKKFCPEKGKAGRPQETADVAEASERYESAGVLVASSEDPQRSWVMDSGCSYHMCPVKEFFENLDQKEHGNVLLGNNKACRVQGVGSVRLKMFDNREMVLQAVRYVPELKRNLISISAFDLGGYTTKVEDGVMRVCSGDSVVAKGRRRNGLYILEGSTVIGHVSVASGTENTARLWHLRMGHISEKGLEELEKQDLLLGDKLQKLDFCDHCVLGKSHRIPFGKGKHSTERPFEYVHADLWGPARTLTHGGGAYFLSIIDDFSRRVWIYVLKNKSETFQKFKEWHTQIENQLGCRLKCLRTDNGLEFVSEEFNGFCKEKGIRRHRTVVGTPQQNGLAERMNKTILERVRCMLLGSGLSKAFWGEAANTAVYLINRSPSSALNFKTPMEVWSGRPADYSHLRVFGSLAFAHVRGDKLDSRAAKCIFLGYADGVKGYRLWRLDSPSKLIISRDVIFDETRMAMHPENSGSEKKILVEVEHTTNGAGTPGGTEENQTGEGQVETGRTIAENRSDEFRTDLGDDTDGMSGEGSHGKAAGVDLRNYQLVRDRERRISKPTKRLGEADLICYALNAAEDINRSDEPRSYKEALDSSDRHLWQGAMEEELEALKKNNTWRLVDLPKGKKVIGSKWIFKKKEATPGGEKARYKARLVAKGFTQIEGVDYHEIFAPVVKHCSVRVLMAIVAHCNLHLEQLDVRTAFLHGDLEETIYMKQPDGFAVDDRVCLLQKSLYGLKQSPRQWYRKFDDFLIKLNFKRCNYDDCVYTLNHGGEMLYLLLYVDDILIASSDRGMIGETKARLADAFEMKELGEARRILGIDIKRDRPGGNLFLSQECYLQKVISRYRMAESKMANTPVGQHLKLTKEQCPKTEEERKKMESVPFSNGIGSIMYGMVCTRPDVAHGVSVLSQFMVNPGPTHWEALKWMLRYIRGSLGTGLSFQNNFQGGGYIEGFVDSDFAGCMDTRKSRSGYVFTLFGTAVSWRSTLQSVVALSTTEAEYYALAEGVKEALWLKGLVRELGFDQKSVCVHCDSQSAIHLANHQIYHSRTKHIDVKLHFVRSIVESGDVQICKIASEENPADMLTKPLAKERFLLLLSRIRCLPGGH